MVLIQEQIEREAIAISLKAARLTTRVLAMAFRKARIKIETVKEKEKEKMPSGKQSVRQLMGQKVPTSTIEISGDRGRFDKIARKWNVDYAFHKAGPEKYLLLFKGSQADAVTAAFSEYASLVLNPVKAKVPIMERFKRALEQAKKQPVQQEKKMERQVERD